MVTLGTKRANRGEESINTVRYPLLKVQDQILKALSKLKQFLGFWQAEALRFVWSDFCMTLKNGFGKCLLFVLSANG